MPHSPGSRGGGGGSRRRCGSATPSIPFLPGSDQTSTQSARQRLRAEAARRPAGGPGSPQGRPRWSGGGPPAETYLLQQRDGVPAVVQPRGEAGCGGRVVVLGGLGDELGDGDLVRHPAEGGETQAGAGGESRRRLPGLRAARRLMNAPRSPPPAARPGAAPGPGGDGGRKGGRSRRRRWARGPSNSEPRARQGALGDPPPCAHAGGSFSAAGKGTRQRDAKGSGRAARSGRHCLLGRSDRRQRGHRHTEHTLPRAGGGRRRSRYNHGDKQGSALRTRRRPPPRPPPRPRRPRPRPRPRAASRATFRRGCGAGAAPGALT